MRRAALAAMLLSLAWPGYGFFARVNGPRTGVLWNPPESFSDWETLAAALRRAEGVKLTVAVSAEMLTPQAERTLLGLVQEGRVEAALRLQGDPVLPMVASHPDAPRPQDAADRVAAAREQYRLVFAQPPAGLVPGGGTIDLSILESMRSMGISWVAVGDYAGSSVAWTQASGMVLAPFKPVADILPGAQSAPTLYVIDEAGGPAPEGSLLKLLNRLGETKGEQGWGTVSELVKAQGAKPPRGPAPKGWPSWSDAYDSWTGHPLASQAWRIYGETALALERYQNSGNADLKALESATDELYLAQSSRYYRLLASGRAEEASAADRELRGRLMSVYRRLKLTPPETLYASLLGRAPASVSSDPVSTDVHFSHGDGWLAFENPPETMSRAPDGAASLDDGSPAEQLWKILELRVEWSDQGITFVYRMARLENVAGAPGELGSLLLDTYIDINHVVGAGSTLLLEGRGAYAAPRDAWEYALALSAWGAYLYRSNPLGTPLLVGKLGVSAEAAKGEVRVSVPGSLLKGNPLRWGYTVLAMAVDPATMVKPPPKPLKTAGGGAILGLLAPLEQQKAFFEAPASAAGRRRLAAVRARTN